MDYLSVKEIAELWDLVTDGEKNWQVSLFGQAGSRFRPGMKVRLDMQEKRY